MTKTQQPNKTDSYLTKVLEELKTGKLRDDFEELFPKDQEAIDGIRPSKSNRSAALVLWAYFFIEFEKALTNYGKELEKEFEIERQIHLQCEKQAKEMLEDKRKEVVTDYGVELKRKIEDLEKVRPLEGFADKTIGTNYEIWKKGF